MPIIAALISTFIAGVINGSFALPTKNLKQWNFEHIWLNYAIWGFLILPWVIIFILAPNAGSFYQTLPAVSVWILLIGGALFGIGQICFARALKIIGFGLGFVINIGLGTALGFLLPLIILNPEKTFTPFGFITLLGTLFITGGLILSYKAGKERDIRNQHNPQMASSTQYSLGVGLAVVAGLFSAGQNFTFAATHNVQEWALAAGLNPLASAIIIWPVFLFFSFIPYAIYMLRLHYKNHSFSDYRGPKTWVNIPIAFMMGFFWYFSVVLYSHAALLIGKLGPVAAWPLFMVMIILTSNFWGWRHQEWANCSANIQRKALGAVILLVIAVAILAYSVTLS